MKNKIINLFIITSMIGLFSSCTEKDHYDAPASAECVNPGLAKTKEVAALWATAPTGASPDATVVYHNYSIPGDPTSPEILDYIEGYVISSDEGGNFFKSMYVQPTDGSRGYNLSVDAYNLYTTGYQPGKKVFLKLNGLAYANPSSYARGLVFGAPPTDIYAVDRLSVGKLSEHLIPSCDIVGEDTYVKHLTLAQALNDTYLNTLVEIDGVQFKSDCATYSKKDFDTSLKIWTGSGTTLDVRTSRFANFAGYSVPSGNGKIRGVLSKYNSGYQIILRTERDVKFTNPRVATPTPALGGTALTYSGAFTETFESYSTTTTGAVLPKYINAVTVGTKYWEVATFSSKKYIQTSAFNNGCTKNYFVVPVDFTAANKFSFTSLDGYNDGVPLKVYYSTDFTPANGISQATLVDITSNFIIADGRPDTATGYASGFTPSGDYNIPAALTGNGYFIFEYDGTTGKTTTIEIDDIKVN
ncbi:DUF5689 domain-containing protein [Flavobacterium sp.]|uniref:DUF5689 domain-containing protein n=1 Tax=Flavobacterium sp. TaxID=239 RepID=UPI00286D31DD|nr:DUF5689 domain-containing protein [Flavobacterium sp.]